MALTELERVLMARLEEKDEKAEKADDYYKWWSDEQQENNRLYEKYTAAKKRIEELENELLELSQAKTQPAILTDSNAKGEL